MREQEEIKEAEYFLSRMRHEKDRPEYFCYNLSAFLTAARSVLQYAQDEIKGKIGGQYWYDSQVSARPVMGFFKDKRDLNVHVEPVNLRRDVTINVFDAVHLTVAPSVEIGNQERSMVTPTESEQTSPQEIGTEPPTLGCKYFFQDWRGSEDVIELCRQYLDKIKEFAKDGVDKGFLQS